jgi:hypothetical protein
MPYADTGDGGEDLMTLAREECREVAIKLTEFLQVRGVLSSSFNTFHPLLTRPRFARRPPAHRRAWTWSYG